MNYVLQLAAAFSGSMGFALLFQVRRGKLLLASLGDLLARVVKCPATLFLVTAAVPLIPGGSLYNTMRYFVEGDFAASSSQGLNTILLALAIAAGMIVPMSMFQLVRRVRVWRAKKV